MFSIQSLQDLAAKGTLFSPNLLPDEFNNLITGLVNVVAQQHQEILDLHSELRVLRKDITGGGSKLFKKPPSIDNSQQNALLEIKIETMEKIQQGMKDQLADLYKQQQDAYDEMHRKQREMRAKLMEITPAIPPPPSTYARDFDKPVVINNELTDISPMLRGIFRDSRRLDGMNELISNIKLECESVVDAMENAQENLQQFNHNLHDLSMTDQKIRDLINERSEFFQTSIGNLEAQIGQIMSYIFALSENQSHTVANASEAIDQIQSILTMMSTRPIPPITDLGDILLEINRVNEDVFEKKTQFEGERERYRRYPRDIIIDSFKGANVQIHQLKKVNRIRSMRQNQYENAGKGQGNYQPLVDDSIVQMTLEELRMKMNELTRNVEDMDGKFSQLSVQTEHQIEDKVDSVSVDRIFNKMYAMIERINKRMDEIEENSQERSTSKSSKRQVTTSLEDNIRRPSPASRAQKSRLKTVSQVKQRVIDDDDPASKNFKGIVVKNSRPRTATARLASSHHIPNMFE